MPFLCNVAAEMSPPFVLGLAPFPVSQKGLTCCYSPFLLSSLFGLNLLLWGIPAPDPSASCGGWQGAFWGTHSAGLAGCGVGGGILAGSPSWPSPRGGKRAGFCKTRKAAGSGRAELVYPGQGLRGLTRLRACGLFEIPTCVASALLLPFPALLNRHSALLHWGHWRQWFAVVFEHL